MTRRLLNLLTALSLLLCMATVGLLILSFLRIDTVRHLRIEARAEGITSREWGIWQSSGGATVWWSGSVWPDKRPPPLGVRWEFNTGPNDLIGPFAHLARFGVEPRAPIPERKKSWGWHIHFPIWVAALAFALLPAGRMYSRLRRPHAPGHCPACGYDLRAAPGRCPECGTHAATSA